MIKSRMLVTLLCLVYTVTGQAKGTLSDNIRIQSKVLDYALQYRVYTPQGMKKTDKLPTIYLTDGQ
jgi:enterochelin esterase-like enzyme